ncbi:hypothetical protein RSAG8_00827, partial [Rhizoctonia solani AG-8 WAC10335]
MSRQNHWGRLFQLDRHLAMKHSQAVLSL